MRGCELMPSSRASRLEDYCDPDSAEHYDERWSGRRGRRRDARKVAAIERALGTLGLSGQDLTVLDAPAGTGRFRTLWSAGRHRVVGLDGSLAMLTVAQRRGWPGMLVAGDLGALPMRSVDVAVCIRFFHLVRDAEDRRHFLRELARVARVGVVIDVRHGLTLRGLGRAVRRGFGRLAGRAGPRRWPSPSEWVHEVESAGLQVVGSVPVRRPLWLSDKLLLACRPGHVEP